MLFALEVMDNAVLNPQQAAATNGHAATTDGADHCQGRGGTKQHSARR